LGLLSDRPAGARAGAPEAGAVPGTMALSRRRGMGVEMKNPGLCRSGLLKGIVRKSGQINFRRRMRQRIEATPKPSKAYVEGSGTMVRLLK